MKPEELKTVLEKHLNWLKNEENGVRADLRSTNLRFADLRSANLRFADLRSSDLRFANLRFADLRSSNLCSSDLRSADLRFANLRFATLSFATLRFANLSFSNLSFSNLRSADLRSANLRSADLRSSNLKEAILGYYMICPEEGSFTAFKKLADDCIATLKIPAKAERTSVLIGRKCRASEAKVISIVDKDGNKIQESRSSCYSDFIYRVGETVIPDSYDPDIRIESSHGIHFYITKQEAIDFD